MRGASLFCFLLREKGRELLPKEGKTEPEGEKLSLEKSLCPPVRPQKVIPLLRLRMSEAAQIGLCSIERCVSSWRVRGRCQLSLRRKTGSYCVAEVCRNEVVFSKKGLIPWSGFSVRTEVRKGEAEIAVAGQICEESPLKTICITQKRAGKFPFKSMIPVSERENPHDIQFVYLVFCYGLNL